MSVFFPSEVIHTAASGGQKGRKLECHSLIPVWPQDEEARVYGYGAAKYSPHNWQKGYPWSWSLDALQRHINAFRRGESKDPESGLHHLAHAKFHLNALMEWERLGVGEDDRGCSVEQAAKAGVEKVEGKS